MKAVRDALAAFDQSSSGFLAAVPQAPLNAASRSIFLGVRSKLRDTSYVADLQLTKCWNVTAVPVFSLSNSDNAPTYRWAFRSL